MYSLTLMFGNSGSVPRAPESAAMNFKEPGMAKDNDKTVLVLGATGGLGAEVARQLVCAGWQVCAMHRKASAARETREGVTWLPGDALNAPDVAAAAQCCSVIVHAVNPPGYQRWSELVMPMLHNTLAAAQMQGATVVLPGNVYNYGPDAWPLAHEDSPQHPTTRKGRIRVDMEDALQAATRPTASGPGCRALIVRAGDFFGPRAGNNWLSQALVKPGKPVRKIQLPGQRGVPHQWGYLPDVARTLVELLARRQTLPAFASFHMAGHVDPDGLAMAQAIQRVVQKHGLAEPRLAAFPWGLIRIAAPFMALPRELLEMRYLWTHDVRLANDRLLQVLGHEPHTPLDEAVEATLLGLGCLPAVRAERTASAR